MEQEVKEFLRKFLAALRLNHVEAIPFTGDEFQNGIHAIEESLKEQLPQQMFEDIADVFAKEPVDEVYHHICSLFMDFNGSQISFSGADNPRWTRMTIKMTPYMADRVLDDMSIFPIDRTLMNTIAKEFCEAAGVLLWEEF
ncbi:MAG: hypothetical protein HFG55_07030 [Lachnospiraceae bacterium]|nr:hypothetical protein [Lachnospiraceae bacterium]